MTHSYVSTLLALTLATSSTGILVSATQAQGNATRTAIPTQLQSLIQNIDAAANQRDLEGLLGFYAPNFTSTDGLSREVLAKVIQRLWQQYPTLTYRTTINRWKQGSNGWEVELTTTIVGEGTFQEQPIALNSKLTSRQRVINNQVAWQDITSEQTTITSGSAPPTVQFNLPAAVKVGQDYNLDVIVQEPLGESLLLGTAVVQPVNSETYLESPVLKLELLPAGGLFKIGRAPNQAGTQWISVALIRDTGKVLMTQRLRVGQP